MLQVDAEMNNTSGDESLHAGDVETPNDAGANKRELYDQEQNRGVEGLPNLGLDSAVDAGVRTHGAAAVSDETYWTGHVLGLGLAIVGIVIIALARGPRKSSALHQLYEQKLATSSKVSEKK